jgi:hypothetical protein
MEVVAAGQFVGQEREIERLAVRQELLEEIVGGLRPGSFVVAARGGQVETGAILQPLMAQLVEAGRTDQEPLGGGEGGKRAVVEGGEDFLDEECGNAVSELLFFIAAQSSRLGALPPSPRRLPHWALVERGSAEEKSGFRKSEAAG